MNNQTAGLGRSLLRPLGAFGAALLLVFGLLAAEVAVAAPANDDFADATVVGPLPVDIVAGNEDATSEPGEPGHYGGNDPSKSIWFKWDSGSDSGVKVIDTCDRLSGLDRNSSVNIGVWTGATLAGLAKVAEGTECMERFTALSDQEYMIAIDFRDDEGTFRFKLRDLSPPANDDFDDALTIGPGLPISVPSSTIDATWESGEPGGLGSSGRSRSIWFRWTPSVTEQVRIDVCSFTTVSGPSNSAVGVYTGAALGSLTSVLPGTSFKCETTLDVTAGVEYRIAFSGSIGGDGTLDFKILPAPRPHNDYFAESETISPTLPAQVSGNNDFATAEEDESGHAGTSSAIRSVWFNWTAPDSGTVRLNACNDSFAARLGVYTGATLAGLDNKLTSPGYSPYCHNDLEAVGGTTYRIAVDGSPFDFGGGDFDLRIRELDRPRNDDLADAIDLGSALPVSQVGTNFGSTTETGEPGHADEFSNPYGSVWYRWTAPFSGPVELDVCDSDLRLRMAVYAGTSMESLVPATGDGDRFACAEGDYVNGKAVLSATEGTTYRIAIDARDQGYEGEFTLNIRDPNPGDPIITPPTPPTGPVLEEPPPTSGVPPVGKPDPQRRFNVRRALRRCLSLPARGRRAKCIKRVLIRAGTVRCRSVGDSKRRTRCIHMTRRYANVTFCRRAYPKRSHAAKANCLLRVKRAFAVQAR